MTEAQIYIGARVRSLRAFAGVPIGTEGIIDEDYGTGVTVAWDFPPGSRHGRPLPPGYRAYDGRWAVVSGVLRDGFDKAAELKFLEAVEG